jgi:hypothetical protein
MGRSTGLSRPIKGFRAVCQRNTKIMCDHFLTIWQAYPALAHVFNIAEWIFGILFLVAWLLV